MSEESLMRLYMKHGRYLMHRNRPTIVTYQLYNDRKVYLTSRCTPVVIDASSKEFGIMVETRLSKHTKVKEIKKEKTVNQRLKDPETPQLSVPDFNFLSPISSEYKFIPDTEKKLTPSPKVSNSNYANKPTTYSETDKSQDYSEVESISITPYLNAESPIGLKRKRNSRIFISAFK